MKEQNLKIRKVKLPKDQVIVVRPFTGPLYKIPASIEKIKADLRHQGFSFREYEAILTLEGLPTMDEINSLKGCYGVIANEANQVNDPFEIQKFPAVRYYYARYKGTILDGFEVVIKAMNSKRGQKIVKTYIVFSYEKGALVNEFFCQLG